MAAKLFRVLLPVNDIELAARFYGALLGAPGRRVSPGRHYFDCGGTILACFDPRADGDGYDPKPNPECLYFAVGDLGGAFATISGLLETGARLEEGELAGAVLGEIATRPWGERSFYCRDPFGNGICFVDDATRFTGQESLSQ